MSSILLVPIDDLVFSEDCDLLLGELRVGGGLLFGEDGDY